MYPAVPKIPTLTVISHPDVRRVGEQAVLWGADPEGEAFLGRRQMLFAQPGNKPERPLEDPYLSRRPVRFAAARFGGVRIDCTRTGTRVIANDDWISDDRVFLGVEVERGVVLVLSERLSVLLHNLTPADADEAPHFGLVGESSAIRRLRREIRDLADQTSPVLLRGEAGSGKKTVARAIHEAAGSARPLVSIFGTDDGARSSVPELMAQAAGGTLMIDAIDRIDSDLQAELLRALQGARGDARTPSVRILATGSDVVPRTAPGPLVEALDWNHVEVPSLSSRRDDVARLIFHFLPAELEKYDAGHRLNNPGHFAAPWFPVRLVAALTSYEWPDNVRQLRRVAHRLARDHHTSKHVDTGIDLEELLEGGSESSALGWGGWSIEESRGAASTASPRRRKLSEIEVLSALRAHRWQAEPAAAHLGISPEALFSMMEKFFDKDQRRKPRRNPL